MKIEGHFIGLGSTDAQPNHCAESQASGETVLKKTPGKKTAHKKERRCGRKKSVGPDLRRRAGGTPVATSGTGLRKKKGEGEKGRSHYSEPSRASPPAQKAGGGDHTPGGGGERSAIDNQMGSRFPTAKTIPI